MKNTFLTIARARLTAHAETDSLLERLRRYPECTLVHLFSHEPVILLFIETLRLRDFDQVHQQICAEPAVAECTYRHLSPALQTFTLPTHEPKTWLL